MKTRHYFHDIGAWPQGVRAVVRAYVIGFVLSLVITGCAYAVATHMVGSISSIGAMTWIILLALAQFLVQTACFLHLVDWRTSRERLVIFASATFIVLILIIGSLWIMTHLNARMMADPAAMQQYMDDQQGI